MRITNIYSKNIQITIRIITLLALIILVVSNIKRFEILGPKSLFDSAIELFTFIVNCISIVLFITVIIYPAKLEILSLVSFFYGSIILIFEPKNNLGTLMFGLSVMILFVRGFFNKNKTIKKYIISILFLCLLISELRFGKEIFLSYFFEKIAYSFIFLSSLFFLQIYTLDMLETTNSTKKLDLLKYPELKKRDAEWLVEIQNGKKYEFIAINYHMSLGSVKNRLRIIFNEIGVGDKQGFLNKYSDYEICFGNDFPSISKDKNEMNK